MATPLEQVTPVSNVQKIWTIPEVIEHLKISRTSVYDDMRSGRLIAHRRGGRTLIFDDDLCAYLNDMPVRVVA